MRPREPQKLLACGHAAHIGGAERGMLEKYEAGFAPLDVSARACGIHGV